MTLSVSFESCLRIGAILRMRFRQVQKTSLDSLHIQQNLFRANLLQRTTLDDRLSEPRDDHPDLQILSDFIQTMRNSTHPTALSAKLRMYFLDSTLVRTTSATCLILPTRSTIYAERPETFSKCIQGVRRIAAKAGSQDDSSSRSIVEMQTDMTLSLSDLDEIYLRVIKLTLQRFLAQTERTHRP